MTTFVANNICNIKDPETLFVKGSLNFVTNITLLSECLGRKKSHLSLSWFRILLYFPMLVSVSQA